MFFSIFLAAVSAVDTVNVASESSRKGPSVDFDRPVFWMERQGHNSWVLQKHLICCLPGKLPPFSLFGFFFVLVKVRVSPQTLSPRCWRMSAVILNVRTGREKEKQNDESNCRLELGFRARHRAELASTWSHFSQPPGKWKSNIQSHFCRVFGRLRILWEIMWLMSLTLCSAANFVCDLPPNRFYYSSSRRNRCLL